MSAPWGARERLERLIWVGPGIETRFYGAACVPRVRSLRERPWALLCNAFGVKYHRFITLHPTVLGLASSDETVLALALADGRVLLTFDKDFGELAFRRGLLATPGVILLRPRLRTLAYLIRFTRAVLSQGHTWEGHFAVAEEGRLRLVPLPA